MNIYRFIPTIISILRIFLGFLLIVLWLFWVSFFTLFWIVLFGLLTDYFDWLLARYRNVQTQFGKQCDHIADKIFMISIFVIILATLYPYNTVWSWLIFVSIILSVMREIYIAWFKTKFPHMVVLQTAKLKTSFQWVAVLLFFLWIMWASASVFLLAMILSLYSAYWYRAIGLQTTRSTWNSDKFFSALSILFGPRSFHFLGIESEAPSVERLHTLFPWWWYTLLIDLDGTIVPFAQPIDTKAFALLQAYRDAWFDIVIYSNSSDTKRYAILEKHWYNVYQWVHPKPSLMWYNEIAQQFWLKLNQAIMLGDSPIADSPLVCEKILLWSILIKPIKPVTSDVMHWLHYYHSLFFQRIIAKRLWVK